MRWILQRLLWATAIAGSCVFWCCRQSVGQQNRPSRDVVLPGPAEDESPNADLPLRSGRSVWNRSRVQRSVPDEVLVPVVRARKRATIAGRATADDSKAAKTDGQESTTKKSSRPRNSVPRTRAPLNRFSFSAPPAQRGTTSHAGESSSASRRKPAPENTTIERASHEIEQTPDRGSKNESPTRLKADEIPSSTESDDSRSPSDASANSTSGELETLTRPWGPLAAALVVGLLSLATNLYLAWVVVGLRRQYQTLLNQRHGLARVLPRSRAAILANDTLETDEGWTPARDEDEATTASGEYGADN